MTNPWPYAEALRRQMVTLRVKEFRQVQIAELRCSCGYEIEVMASIGNMMIRDHVEVIHKNDNINVEYVD